MATNIERMKGWIDGFADDVAIVKRIVEAEKAPKEARRLAAGALNYLVTRMDLIPDWEETCGVIDDAMIVRVAVALASERGLDELDAHTLRGVARLANEAEVVSDFLGKDLYARFKKFTEGLTAKAVRGRHPDQIVDDAKLRAALYAEVGDEMKALPPAPMADPDGIARTVKNYLTQKLGGAT
jgi:uncharacterized membrane protein YkvA (DUF1232 family)